MRKTFLDLKQVVIEWSKTNLVVLLTTIDWYVIKQPHITRQAFNWLQKDHISDLIYKGLNLLSIFIQQNACKRVNKRDAGAFNVVVFSGNEFYLYSRDSNWLGLLTSRSVEWSQNPFAF